MVPELNARFVALKPAAGFALAHKNPVTAMRHDTVSNASAPVKIWQRTKWEPALELEQAAGTAVEFYQRALEYSECGNLRQAERRCRQALYLDPSYVPALELLYTLWQMHPSARLRRALQARIHRIRTAAGSSVCEKEIA